MALIDLTNFLAWWPLGEAAGTRVDAHLARNLTESGTPISGGGKVGAAALFASASFEYLESSDVAFQAGDIDLTLGAWAYIADKTTDRVIISRWKLSTTQASYMVYYKQSSDRFVFVVTDDGVTEYEIAADALGSPSIDTWYFVVAWHDADADTINIQINNGTIDSASHSVGMKADTSKFRIGVAVDVGGTKFGLFEGLIDEAFVTKEILTASEKSLLYNSGRGISYEGITGDLLVFTSPNGVHLNFNDGVATFSLINRRGYHLPTFSHTTDQTPGQPGARYRETRTIERLVSLPLHIFQDDVDDIYNLVRGLANTLNPLLGVGQLRFAVAGKDRFVNCIYKSGLEGEDSQKIANMLAGWYKPSVVFLCPDPYFYDTVELSDEYQIGDVEGSSFLGDPFFPLNISASTVIASPTINNPGDVDVYPVWVITGPGDSLVLLNKTTGKQIDLDMTLGDGQTIEIDTRTEAKTVMDLVTGDNLFSNLSVTSSLWPFEPGDNEIDIQLNAATSTSKIAVAYRPAYYSI